MAALFFREASHADKLIQGNSGTCRLISITCNLRNLKCYVKNAAGKLPRDLYMQD